MPEGDTIYRSAASLRRWLEGRVVTGARAAAPDLAAGALIGRSVEEVAARGKHLLIRFSGGLTLHSHMRMTGSWHVYPAGRAWDRPERQARIVIECGERVAVCFNAPVVELITERQMSSHPSLRRLGPDILIPEALSPEVVRARARWRAAESPTAGEMLLDQQVVSGIGNVYRCEALFLCGIAPRRPVVELDDSSIDALVGTASRLMRANLSTSARRFDGPPGQAWVYRRAARPCRRCSTTVRSEALGRTPRTVYWCPTCQPEPG